MECRIIFMVRFWHGGNSYLRTKVKHPAQVERYAKSISRYNNFKWLRIHRVDDFSEVVSQNNKIGFLTSSGSFELNW